MIMGITNRTQYKSSKERMMSNPHPLFAIVSRRDFSHGKPCRALRCERHRYSFLECEPDYWLTLVRRGGSRRVFVCG